jgi:hypothetical protein
VVLFSCIPGFLMGGSSTTIYHRHDGEAVVVELGLFRKDFTISEAEAI